MKLVKTQSNLWNGAKSYAGKYRQQKRKNKYKNPNSLDNINLIQKCKIQITSSFFLVLLARSGQISTQYQYIVYFSAILSARVPS